MLKDFPRIGYVPYTSDLQGPGDRRRFIAYARARNLSFELARFEERYDVVVLSEAADISLWPEYSHGKIVFDLIDSYLAVPRTDLKQFLRGPIRYALGKHSRLRDYLLSLREMCRRSDAVICATEEQKRSIMQFCNNVHVILDIHSSVTKKIKIEYAAAKPFRLVWEGLPSNLPQLAMLAPVLRSLEGRIDFELNVLTKPGRFPGHLWKTDPRRFLMRYFDHVRLHDWNEETCSEIITSCDLGVIPINLADMVAIGKSENKLLGLWRMGLPVITSATPAYRRVMNEVGTPELSCQNDLQWTAVLDRMMSDEPARFDAAKRGRAYAEEKHGSSAVLARWDTMFSSLGFAFGTSAGSCVTA